MLNLRLLIILIFFVQQTQLFGAGNNNDTNRKPGIFKVFSQSKIAKGIVGAVIAGLAGVVVWLVYKKIKTTVPKPKPAQRQMVLVPKRRVHFADPLVTVKEIPCL